MSVKQMPKAIRTGLFTGILIIFLALIVARIFHLSDSLTGFLMGAGIGMALFSFIKLKRLQQQQRAK